MLHISWRVRTLISPLSNPVPANSASIKYIGSSFARIPLPMHVLTLCERPLMSVLAWMQHKGRIHCR